MRNLPRLDPLDLDEGDFVLVHWAGREEVTLGCVKWLRGLPHIQGAKGHPRPLVGYRSAFLVTGLLASE